MPAESEIVTFLREAGLTKYCPMFLREEIDLAALRLLNDADLQRIGVSSLGPRRKILGLLAQQRQGHAVGPGAPLSHVNASVDESPIRLTPPMLESQLAKRHCCKAPTADDELAADRCQQYAAGSMAAGASSSPQLEHEQSSLWELASRHDARPSEYRTGLLPPGASTGISSQGNGDDDGGLAALDDLLQQSSPPRKSAREEHTLQPQAHNLEQSTSEDASSNITGEARAANPCDVSAAVELSDSAADFGGTDTEWSEPLDRPVDDATADDADADGFDVFAPPSSSSASSAEPSGVRKSRARSWNLTDDALDAALEIPIQFDAAAASSHAAPRLDAVREDYRERLRAVRTEFAREVEEICAGARNGGGVRSTAMPPGRAPLVEPDSDDGNASLSGAVAAAPDHPNFAAMDLAELKRRVKQFGLKTSGKKVMVRQLTEIWAAQNPGAAVLLADAPDRQADAAPGPRLGATTVATAPVAAAAQLAQPAAGGGTDATLSRKQALSRQVRSFVLSQPHWYTSVLLLDAIDMRALHAALSCAASMDGTMIKCSLKQLEEILREAGITFQAQAGAAR